MPLGFISKCTESVAIHRLSMRFKNIIRIDHIWCQIFKFTPFYRKIPHSSSPCKEEKPNLSFTDLEDLFVDSFYKYKCHLRKIVDYGWSLEAEGVKTFKAIHHLGIVVNACQVSVEKFLNGAFLANESSRSTLYYHFLYSSLEWLVKFTVVGA